MCSQQVKKQLIASKQIKTNITVLKLLPTCLLLYFKTYYYMQLTLNLYFMFVHLAKLCSNISHLQ